MINVPNEIIPYSFLFIALLFILSLKKKKNDNLNVKEKINIMNDVQDKRAVLEEAESKLIALKDLYHQELIDKDIYLNKTQLIASNVSEEIGKDIMEFPKIQQRIITQDLKQEIRKKININDNLNVKTNIDNLISAIDNRIKAGNINEEK